MSLLPEQRLLRRYLLTILVITIAAGALLLGALFLRFEVELETRDQLNRYHLRTLLLASEASRQVARLRRDEASDLLEPTAPDPGQLHGRQLLVTLHSLRRAVSSIREIETQFGAPPFRDLVDELERNTTRLELALAEGRRPQLVEELTGLDLRLFQLLRLHTVTANQLLEEVVAEGERSARRLVYAGLAIVVMAGFFVFRLLRLIDQGVREYLLTKEKLVERERELHHANKMQALGTLVGGVAHDFNNLLTAILGHSESLLLDLNARHPHHSSLREIMLAAERAAGLTRQLLAFSRFEPIEPRIVDLNLLVSEMEPLLARLIREDISLRVQCGAKVRQVKVDPVQMEQVIINLAVNARDAMPQGGKLTIRTARVEIDGQEAAFLNMRPGPYSQIEVEDTGCGMSAEIRDRALEPFFTTKERHQGTGLGLATVHGVVKKNDGYVVLKSALGVGTIVRIYLPECDSTHPHTARPSGALPALRPATILVVEDEQQVRKLVTAGLRNAGYRVLSAADGEEALTLSEEFEQAIHLVVTDVVMPGIRGPELVERIQESRQQTKAIFLSGYADNEILSRIDDAPFLAKPFTLENLLALVGREIGS